jgi:CRISPR-associated protein Cst2
MPKRSSKSTSQLSELQDGTVDSAIINEPMAATIVGVDSLSENHTPAQKSKRLHLFGTILTYASPSSNHHGKGDETESPLQTITKQGRDYPIISPYAIRSALREILIVEELPSNRSRINDGGAPKVEFKDFPNPDLYADDFLFGFCVTDRLAVAAHPKLPSRRDSVFRNNMAVALSSNIDVHLQIAPRNTEKSPWNNIKETSLLYRQVSYTAYQYPFALTLTDCLPQAEWTAALIKAIGQLSRVAGGDSVSHFQMAPRSIIVRLTPSLVAGYDNYGFQEDGNFKELNRLVNGELPGQEFWLGGEIVRQMSEDVKKQLVDRQVNLRDSPQNLLDEVSQKFLGGA